jgi:hypothetical protein
VQKDTSRILTKIFEKKKFKHSATSIDQNSARTQFCSKFTAIVHTKPPNSSN